jgi:hypothetical protein
MFGLALPAVTETPPEIAEAIRKASKHRNRFQLFAQDAERESSFVPKAKARTSSAAGLSNSSRAHGCRW